MDENEATKKTENVIQFGRGPLGYGDPDDNSLRKAEKDIIIPKMILEQAVQKCSESFQMFLNCAKEAGLLVIFKCRAENQARNDCLTKWAKNEEFVKEVTDKYLKARSHYRRTGEPLLKYVRDRKRLENISDSNSS